MIYQTTLRAGDIMYPDDRLQASARCFFVLQPADGNLVFYAYTGNDPHATGPLDVIWNTGPSPGHYLALQTDGNLVLYTADHGVVWASDTDRVLPAMDPHDIRSPRLDIYENGRYPQMTLIINDEEAYFWGMRDPGDIDNGLRELKQ